MTKLWKKGELPLLKDGSTWIAGVDRIISHLAKRGLDGNRDLSPEQKAEYLAYVIKYIYIFVLLQKTLIVRSELIVYWKQIHIYFMDLNRYSALVQEKLYDCLVTKEEEA